MKILFSKLTNYYICNNNNKKANSDILFISCNINTISTSTKLHVIQLMPVHSKNYLFQPITQNNIIILKQCLPEINLNKANTNNTLYNLLPSIFYS